MASFEDLFNGTVKEEKVLNLVNLNEIYNLDESVLIEQTLSKLPHKNNFLFFDNNGKECDKDNSIIALGRNSYTVLFLFSMRYTPSEIKSFLDMSDKDFKVILSYLINNYEDVLEIFM